MAIDTPERRRSAIDFGKGARGAGMPVPLGSIPVASRTHAINLYSGIPPVKSTTYFWRNRSRLVTAWRNRGTPMDGSTQTL